MRSSFRKPAAFLALVIIVVSSWGIYHGVRMGVADGVAYKAKYAVKTWEQDNRLPTAEEAAYALQQAASALAWQPENPEYLALKARVLTYQGLLHWGEDRFFEITEEAVTLYQESTRRRPKWPYSWSGLALVKAYRAEFDDVYKEVVAKAVKFGPWEPGVHRTLALAGLTG
jgi:hypothetical protein